MGRESCNNKRNHTNQNELVPEAHSFCSCRANLWQDNAANIAEKRDTDESFCNNLLPCQPTVQVSSQKVTTHVAICVDNHCKGDVALAAQACRE
jgi:hypothetical protein